MIEKLDELKETFSAHKQGFGRLIQTASNGNNYCYCAEGIFMIVVGAEIIHGVNPAFCLDGELYNAGMPIIKFCKLNLLSYIEREKLLGWSEQLELTTQQIYKINCSGSAMFTWSELNDYIRLTFHQFPLLLDLLHHQ